uniref:Uncharacterized protein n=1 Tax=Oryza meridionalis TaxID=40149 RepID=A0A0E0F0A4_9ORYZ
MRWAAESIRQQSLAPLEDPTSLIWKELIIPTMVDGDIAGELIPDDLKAFVDLAGAATDDVVKATT